MNKKQLKSQEYWKKRMDDILADVDKMDVAFYNNMQQTYLDSLKDVQKDIYDFYARYAKDNEISYSEAKRRLLREDLSDYRANAEKYFKQAEKDPELLKRLNEQYQSGKVTRLEALNLSLEYQLGVLNGTLQQSFSDYLKDIANHVYKKVNFGLSSSTLNKPVLEELIRTRLDGKNYSSSLWGNTDALADDLKQIFKTGFIRGSGPAEIARELRKKYNVARSRAETIIRTDGTNIINLATAKRYQDAGLKTYRIHVHMDKRTSDECKEINRQDKLYKFSEYMPGLTAPPFHYNCRSTVVPDEDELNREI